MAKKQLPVEKRLTMERLELLFRKHQWNVKEAAKEMGVSEADFRSLAFKASRNGYIRDYKGPDFRYDPTGHYRIAEALKKHNGDRQAVAREIGCHPTNVNKSFDTAVKNGLYPNGLPDFYLTGSKPKSATGKKAKAAQEAAKPGTASETIPATAREVINARREADKAKDQLKAVTDREHEYEREIANLKHRTELFDAAVEATAKRPLPAWLLEPSTAGGGGVTGVPTIFLSDLHCGETVDPDSVEGCNKYNRKIFNERARAVVGKTVELCQDYFSKPNYPGIVAPLGGDLIAGDIHEELVATNDGAIMDTVLDCHDALAWSLKTLADEFGSVFVPTVIGNHGRANRWLMKPCAKRAVESNFDYLIYGMLLRTLSSDPRIHFHISKSLDTTYRVFGTTYRLTHGDQFKGGSGIVGIDSPIKLGDHRKRKRQNALRRPYDWLIMGHWHQVGISDGLIRNGSLVGYDEYAYMKNFEFQDPAQALWITHPKHEITYWMPVRLISDKGNKNGQWASIPEATIREKVA